jgi:ribosomal protein L21E
MRKKRFRIISYNNKDNSFYETKVKTWLGWVSFTVFYKTDIIHILSDPSVHKSMAYERIYQYCEVKGYNKKDIDITEINTGKAKKWIFFQRVYSDQKTIN